KDGVVWACQRGAFVKVAVSQLKVHMGPGLPGPTVPDMLCRITWYRHIAPEEPNAWLSAAPADDLLAFATEYSFPCCTGGYVTEPDAGAYHFPLSILDLKTGTDRTLILRVPYQGKLPDPQSNYTSVRWPQGKRRIQTTGPHVLAIAFNVV